MTTIGTRRVSSCALSSRTRPRPSIIGMRISVRTRSAPARTIAQIAPNACSASWTSYPAFRSERLSISRISESSSTMRILFLVLDFVMFAFRWLRFFQIVRLNPIPVPASCIVNLYRRGRQCDNANPVGIARARDRAINHGFADDSEKITDARDEVSQTRTLYAGLPRSLRGRLRTSHAPLRRFDEIERAHRAFGIPPPSSVIVRLARLCPPCRGSALWADTP